MNIEINNHAKGHFTIENDKGEIIHETDNSITDYGLQALRECQCWNNSWNWISANQHTNQLAIYTEFVEKKTNFQYSQNANGDIVLTRTVRATFRCINFNGITITNFVVLSQQASVVDQYLTLAKADVSLTFLQGQCFTVIHTLTVTSSCNKVLSNMN